MPYLSIDEFADSFGFTKVEVRNHICDGMPAESLNEGPRIIDEDEALAWLEARDLVEDVEEDEDEDESDLDDED